MVNDSGFCRRDFNVGIVHCSNSQTSYLFKFRRFISALKCDSNIVFFFKIDHKNKKLFSNKKNIYKKTAAIQKKIRRPTNKNNVVFLVYNEINVHVVVVIWQM